MVLQQAKGASIPATCQNLDAQEISIYVDSSGTMIVVHHLNKQPFVLNVFHIVSVERTPETIVTLFSGEKLRIADTPEEVVARSEAFLQCIGRMPPANLPGGDP